MPVIRENITPAKGKINLHRKKMKNKTNIKPYCSRIARVLESKGKIEKSSLEPSRGGIGVRLKRARIMFINTITLVISRKLGFISPAKRRIIMPKMKAITRFEAGPAKATRASPQRLFFKL